MTSLLRRASLRMPLLLLVAALALAVAAGSAAAAVSISVSGSKRGNVCRSTQALSDYGSWTCLTKGLRVVAPGGPIRYSYKVNAGRGCETVGAIVRTTGKGSFTQFEAAPGARTSGSLTWNLSTIDPRGFEPRSGSVLTLSIELPWNECDTLKAFDVTVRFPTLTKAR
jgi:hypothetical protein